MIQAFVLPELGRLRQENCPQILATVWDPCLNNNNKIPLWLWQKTGGHLCIQLRLCALRTMGWGGHSEKLQAHFGAETPHFLEGKQLLFSNYFRNNIQFPTFQVYELLLLFSEINYIQEKGELTAPHPPAPPLCRLAVCGEGCWLGLRFTLGEFFF